MDALELLKTDHDEVKRLFDQVRAETSRMNPMLFNRIRDALEAHTYMEESVLYPSLRKFPECVALVDRSLAEHRQVTELLTEMSRSHQNDPMNYSAKINELIQAVESHIGEEEGQLFPEIRKIMKRPERDTLGRHLEMAKRDFQTEHREAA